jgi:restriction endonuclease S subunit
MPYVCSRNTEVFILRHSLGHIANITTGLYAQPTNTGEIIYLQAKHFDESGQLSAVLQPEVKRNKQSERHMLQDKDILFAAKGLKNFATVYENDNGHCVASTTFLVIRLKNESDCVVLPEFLAWFINHPRTQVLLKRKAKGTSLRSISKQMLEELEIPIPSFDKQRTILAIYNLHQRQEKLEAEIRTLKGQMIQHLMIKTIEQDR